LPADLSRKYFIRPELKNVRSQDLPKYYRLNGAVYLADMEYLIYYKGFLGDKTKALIMLQEKSVDVDSKIDFLLAQFFISKLN